MKKLNKIFKALSDPTRLRLLNLLQTGELCVCDLTAVLDMPQSTISRHLATLRHAGLVNDERRGQWMYYSMRVEQNEFSRKLLKLLSTEFDAQETAVKDLAALRHRSVERKELCA